MKKIPTIFLRDFVRSLGSLTDEQNSECAWVFAGEGIATRKLDGTCCMIRDGKLFKRREVKDGDPVPPVFETVEIDTVTGKGVGWVPVGDGPEDRWHREAFQDWQDNGTYELIGPKVQGNPEGMPDHRLISHDAVDLMIDVPIERTFVGIKWFLEHNDMEGIVFHHPDGRMAKIKGRDFGLKRLKRDAA